MGYSVCRRAQDRAPTFRVVTSGTGSLYRGTDFTLSVYATDENGCFLNVSGTATLSLSGADVLDALDDNGTPLSTITITNGIWTSSQVAIDGGSGPETGVTIDCDSSGFTTGTSDSFSLSESGVVASFNVAAIGNMRTGFASDASYLYAAGDSDPAIWRVALSDFSTTDKYNRSTFGLSGNLTPLAVDATNFYTGDASGHTSKVLLADMATYTTVVNTANTISPSVGYLYVADGSNVKKIQISDMTQTASTARRYDWQAMDVDDTYIYGCPYGTKTIEKRLQSDLSVDSTLDLSSYVSNTFTSDNNQVTVSGGYIYLTVQQEHTVIKIKASDMTYVSSYTSYANIGYVGGLGTDGTYLWVAGNYCSPGNIAKFTKLKASDMSLVWSIDVSAYTSATIGDYQHRVQLRGGYAYAVYTTSSVILKIAQ